VQLISLQKGAGADQLTAQYPILNLANRIDETSGAFMDTAAIMMNIDLVVCSDSAVAHLAGALGVPVWVALPQVPDWRWLLEREDSPWYPSMRLFRQARRDNWEDVFQRIADELAQCVHHAAINAAVTD
jgi:ADP-heptose:LPS heptosyltransferase